MAFIQLNTYSQALGLSVGVHVLLPEGGPRAQQQRALIASALVASGLWHGIESQPL